MVEVDDDIFLAIADHDEKASFLLLGAISNQCRYTGVTVQTLAPALPTSFIQPSYIAFFGIVAAPQAPPPPPTVSESFVAAQVFRVEKSIAVDFTGRS